MNALILALALVAETGGAAALVPIGAPEPTPQAESESTPGVHDDEPPLPTTGPFALKHPQKKKPRPREKGNLIGKLRVVDETLLPPSGKKVSRKKRCDGSLAPEALRLGPDNVVEGAVVWISKTPKGWYPPEEPAPPKTVVMRRAACYFEPDLLEAEQGATLRIRATNQRIHTLRAISEESPADELFYLSLVGAGAHVDRRLMIPGNWRVGCEAGHGDAAAHVMVFEHPFHTRTDAKGAFDLGQVPHGKHEIVAWHPVLGRTTGIARVRVGKTVEVEITYGEPPPVVEDKKEDAEAEKKKAMALAAKKKAAKKKAKKKKSWKNMRRRGR